MHEYNKVLNRCRKVINSCTNYKQLRMAFKYCIMLLDRWYKILAPNTHAERQSYKLTYHSVKEWAVVEIDKRRTVLSAKG